MLPSLFFEDKEYRQQEMASPYCVPIQSTLNPIKSGTDVTSSVPYVLLPDLHLDDFTPHTGPNVPVITVAGPPMKSQRIPPITGQDRWRQLAVRRTTSSKVTFDYFEGIHEGQQVAIVVWRSLTAKLVSFVSAKSASIWFSPRALGTPEQWTVFRVKEGSSRPSFSRRLSLPCRKQPDLETLASLGVLPKRTPSMDLEFLCRRFTRSAFPNLAAKLDSVKHQKSRQQLISHFLDSLLSFCQDLVVPATCTMSDPESQKTPSYEEKWLPDTGTDDPAQPSSAIDDTLPRTVASPLGADTTPGHHFSGQGTDPTGAGQRTSTSPSPVSLTSGYTQTQLASQQKLVMWINSVVKQIHTNAATLRCLIGGPELYDASAVPFLASLQVAEAFPFFRDYYCHRVQSPDKLLGHCMHFKPPLAPPPTPTNSDIDLPAHSSDLSLNVTIPLAPSSSESDRPQSRAVSAPARLISTPPSVARSRGDGTMSPQGSKNQPVEEGPHLYMSDVLDEAKTPPPSQIGSE